MSAGGMYQYARMSMTIAQLLTGQQSLNCVHLRSATGQAKGQSRQRGFGLFFQSSHRVSDGVQEGSVGTAKPTSCHISTSFHIS